MDIVYVLVIVVFFGAALAYVQACAALGREEQSDQRGHNVG